MKAWKKYAIGGLAGLVLSGGLYIKGHDLTKRAEAIRTDYPEISKLEELGSARKTLGNLMLAYSLKENIEPNDLKNQLKIAERYKEVAKNFDYAKQIIDIDPNLTYLLKKERNYDYDAQTLKAPLIVYECFGIMSIFFAAIIAPFIPLAAGMVYLQDKINKKKV